MPAPGLGFAAAGIALWAGLVLLFALHLVAAWSSARTLWGFDALRYTPVTSAVALAVLWALALVPALGRRVEPVVARFASGPAPWLVFVAVVLATRFDRLQFLGDWLMRRSSAALGAPVDSLYPQALPLDLFLHIEALRPLTELVGVDAATRTVGALEAALFVGAAFLFISRLRLAPRARLAVAAVTIATGTLQLFTGFNKAACEVCVLTALAMACAAGAASSVVSVIGLGAVAAAAVLVHRVGILLVPAVPIAIVVYLRHASPGLRRWLPAFVAPALPAIALVLVGPRIWHLFLTFDWPRHVVGATGAPLAHALSLGHLGDVANALGILAPLAFAGWLAVPLAMRRARGPELLALAAVAAPMALPLLFIHPQQGVFRDLDVLAPGGVALGFLAAWAVGRVVESEQAPRGLAVAVAASCLLGTLAWLGLVHDPVRGARWVESFARPESGRSESERALTWDFLGYRAMNASEWSEANRAWDEASRLTPSARILSQLGMSEIVVGHLDRAHAMFSRSLALDSTQALSWRGLATTSFRLGDYDEAQRAAFELQRRHVNTPELPELLRALDRVEAFGARSGRKRGTGEGPPRGSGAGPG